MTARLADFFSHHKLVDFARKADNDEDAVTFDWLAMEDSKPHDVAHPPEVLAGALIFVKGDGPTKALAKWCEEQGYIKK